MFLPYTDMYISLHELTILYSNRDWKAFVLLDLRGHRS
jgi:hypothetical protein